MKKIAVIGFGVVGSGVLEVIKTNKEILDKSTPEGVEVKRILDIRDFSDHEDSHLFTKNFDDILNDEEIEIVVETMGGVKFAYEYTLALLKKGKSVVTSNKELVSKKGDEFFKIAKEKNCRYLYEASVGGGIPLIRPIACDVSANNITKISGILNGTTNYILTKMLAENDSFENALKNAQSLGYAEKDPTADVDGIDACRKIAILMSLISGKKVESEKVHTIGIRNVSAEDVTYATALGCTIKLIASGFTENGKVSASVEPMLVPSHHPLSTVESVFNGAFLHGNMVDDLMFYGRGAGKCPTASAVVSDIIDISRNPYYTPYYSWSEDACDLIPYEEIEAKFLVRINKEQKEKALQEFPGIEIIKGVNDYGFVTGKMPCGELLKHIDNIGGCVSKIRLF